MLEKIQFSADDTLYILGDVIDREPVGIPCRQKIMVTPNIVMLLGNYEHMMLCLYRWYTLSTKRRGCLTKTILSKDAQVKIAVIANQ